jgi:hypothetical protein
MFLGFSGAPATPPAAPTLTAPVDNSDVYDGSGITVSATSTDGDLTRIDWVLDPGGSEVVVATDAAAAYSQTWTPSGVSVGAHTLVARAWRSGLSTDSTAIDVVLFDPTIPEAPLWWLQGDTGVTIDTGVSLWEDQSASGLDVSQATGGAQPTLAAAAAAYNYHDVLDFDGTDDKLAGAAASAVAALPAVGTWFVVFDFDAITTNAAAMYLNDCLVADSVSATAGIALRSGVPDVRPWKFDGAVKSTGHTIAATTPAVLSVKSTGDNGDVFSWLNGADPKTADLTAALTAAAGVVQIGVNYAGAQFFNGRIAEIVAYSTALSDALRLRVERYLGARYGISVA